MERHLCAILLSSWQPFPKIVWGSRAKLFVGMSLLFVYNVNLVQFHLNFFYYFSYLPLWKWVVSPEHCSGWSQGPGPCDSAKKVVVSMWEMEGAIYQSLSPCSVSNLRVVLSYAHGPANPGSNPVCKACISNHCIISITSSLSTPSYYSWIFFFFLTPFLSFFFWTSHMHDQILPLSYVWAFLPVLAFQRACLYKVTCPSLRVVGIWCTGGNLRVDTEIFSFWELTQCTVPEDDKEQMPHLKGSVSPAPG